MRKRPRLVAVAERLVRRGANLVRPPPLEQLRPAEREAEVRTAELVRRADQHVDTGLGDVDRAVRRVVDGVDPRERPCRVGELRDARHVRQRPYGVRRPRERDDARPLAELSLEVGEVERAVVADVGEPHDEVVVAGELEPRRGVRVVVEPRHDDLVARAPLAGRRPGEGEVERRHVRAEHDLLR